MKKSLNAWTVDGAAGFEEMFSQVKAAGFDGIELGQYAVPRLATVSQPQQEIADQSVALLLGQIEKAAPPQTRVVSTGLLEGESVASVTSDI